MTTQGQHSDVQWGKENVCIFHHCGITKVVLSILFFLYFPLFLLFFYFSLTLSTVTQSRFTIGVNFWFDMSFDVRWIFHLSLRLLLGLDSVRDRKAIEDSEGERERERVKKEEEKEGTEEED